MAAESFVSWLVVQALGPEIVTRGLDALASKSWRADLARRLEKEAGGGIPRRRLRRWLNRPTTWNDLVELSPAGIERLTHSLASALKPQVALRRSRYSDPQLREEAERLAPIIIGEFLAALDPSLATSVAHFREMSELGHLKTKVEAIAELLDVDSEMDALLGRIPHTAKGPVDTLRQESPSTSTALLKSVFSDKAGPRAAVIGLLRVSPQWLKSGPYSAWLVIAELSSAHGEHAASSQAFEEATERGAPNRDVYLARAAAEAATADDMERANRLLRVARKLDGNGGLFVEIIAAALGEDYASVIELATTYPEDDQHQLVGGIKGNAYLALKQWDDAIATFENQLKLEPRAAGTALRISQALLARVTEGKTDRRQADVKRAREMALKARDLRREWLGPSDEAVAVACRAAVAAHAWEEAIGLGLAFPDGQATPEEAASQEVLPVVAAAAIVARHHDIAEAAIARMTDSFEKAYQTVLLAEDQHRDREQLVAEYRQCWNLAKTFEQRFSVQMGLASVGAWPIEDLDDLQREDPERAEIVTALSESQRGLHDQAISRLRKLPESSRAQELLANIYGEAGRLPEAIETFREARRRFDEPLFSVRAARFLMRSGQLDEAEQEANSTLASLAEGSSAGVELRLLLIDLAAGRGQWATVEALARGLVSEDEADSDARWLLVVALQNQGRVDNAWRALTVPQPLWPSTEVQARLWLDLHRRFGKGVSTVQQVLRLASEYEDSEEVFAAALLTVYELSRERTLPEATVANLHQSTESFLERFPESQLFQKLDFGNVDELIGQVRKFVEPGAAEFEGLAKSVIQRWHPYVVLSAYVARPYTEALLRRAAGCLPQEIQEPAIRESELRAAGDAKDQEVVIDPSALATFSLFPDHWLAVLGVFSRLLVTTPAYHDIQSARASLAVKSTMTLGWDTRAGIPRVHEIPQEVADELARRSDWIAKAASGLGLVDIHELETFPGLEFERFAAALTSLEIARRQGVPLFSADAGLRLLARSMDIPTFGVLSLLQVMESRGGLPSGSVASMVGVMRREFVVDLETTQEDLMSLAAENAWQVGPASYVMTRPAFWRNRQEALNAYKQACNQVATQNREALPGWVGAAVYGIALGQDSRRIAGLAGSLLTYATVAAEFDQESFARLLGAVRSATEDLGGEDPLPTTLGQLIDAFKEQFHPELAARMALVVASQLPETDRQMVVRLILGKS